MPDEKLIETLLVINGALLTLIMERLFSLTSKFGTLKIEIMKEFQILRNKQMSEGTSAHERMDKLDRIVSAITDEEFGSTRNIVLGTEEFPKTTLIRSLLKTNG
jgi:hypothetical protein